jgi:hypothetical protein
MTPPVLPKERGDRFHQVLRGLELRRIQIGRRPGDLPAHRLTLVAEIEDGEPHGRGPNQLLAGPEASPTADTGAL